MARVVVLQHASAADAVLASASLPSILPPVNIDGHALIDGDLIDNTPISVGAALGVDSIRGPAAPYPYDGPLCTSESIGQAQPSAPADQPERKP